MPPPQVRLQGPQLPQGPQRSLCRLTLGAWKKRHAEECESLSPPTRALGLPRGPLPKNIPRSHLGSQALQGLGKNTRHPEHSFTELAGFHHKGPKALLQACPGLLCPAPTKQTSTCPADGREGPSLPDLTAGLPTPPHCLPEERKHIWLQPRAAQACFVSL